MPGHPLAADVPRSSVDQAEDTTSDEKRPLKSPGSIPFGINAALGLGSLGTGVLGGEGPAGSSPTEIVGSKERRQDRAV